MQGYLITPILCPLYLRQFICRAAEPGSSLEEHKAAQITCFLA